MKGASFIAVAAVILASFLSGANADCTPAAPNPCYNAPGNASICCPGACGPSTGEGGVTATCASTPPPATLTPAPTTKAPTPAPTTSGAPGTVYIVFDFSKPETNCANQAAAPGGGYTFGDICLYKGPILASDLTTVVGTYIESDTTFFADNNTDILTAATTFYFTTGSILGPVDSIDTLGTAATTDVTELAIVGGTGKYRGADGYVVSGLGVDLSPGADGSVLAFPKEFHLF